MKCIRQPLSEDFVYGSPDSVPDNSFRWILVEDSRKPKSRKPAVKGGRDGHKYRN
jgi:hypothetical protein